MPAILNNGHWNQKKERILTQLFLFWFANTANIPLVLVRPDHATIE